MKYRIVFRRRRGHAADRHMELEVADELAARNEFAAVRIPATRQCRVMNAEPSYGTVENPWFVAEVWRIDKRGERMIRFALPFPPPRLTDEPYTPADVDLQRYWPA